MYSTRAGQPVRCASWKAGVPARLLGLGRRLSCLGHTYFSPFVNCNFFQFINCISFVHRIFFNSFGELSSWHRLSAVNLIQVSPFFSVCHIDFFSYGNLGTSSNISLKVSRNRINDKTPLVQKVSRNRRNNRIH